MAPTIATNTEVGLDELLEFVRSPVTGGSPPEVAER